MGRQRNYAGVDQTLHGFFGLVDRTPSNAFRISSGNGPSKSSAILMVSPYAPSYVCDHQPSRGRAEPPARRGSRSRSLRLRLEQPG